jgi:hypothetical protein
VEGFDSSGDSLGDLTALAAFTISAGTCTGAVCTGDVGTQNVTATVAGVSVQYSLTTAALPVDPTEPAEAAAAGATAAATGALAESGRETPVGLLLGAVVSVVAGVAALVLDSRRRRRA